MAQPLLKTSKITAKGQTTVPDAVRQALGVGAGDRIVFAVDGDAVTVRRADDVGDPALDRFLSFLAQDIQRRPENLAALSPVLAERLAGLVADIDIDLDAPIDGDVSL